jgi:cytochrome oxidase Cu insertion factor (SCO1/SenC/PrrC family)
MNSGLSPSDPVLVAAFRSALLHQGAIALLIIAFLWLAWATARTWQPAKPATKGGASAGTGVRGWGTAGGQWARRVRAKAGAPEAPARQLLRVGFGALWIFDGILQTQPKMAGGLATQVIEPIAASSPVWVQHLINWGGTAWSYHPIQAGAASVWIQVGIGAWLIVASRGSWSRLAGAAGVTWGLVVWVFGESFGGIFAPGLSWLTGAPGGVLFYVVAGALIALPEEAWRSPRLGRLLSAGLGLFFVGMAILQAWPGRGFWQGTAGGKPGTLAGMVQTMAGTSQPHFLSSWLASFGAFTARNGFAVNLVVVIALAAMGAIFLTGRPRLVRYAVWFGIAFCLADWVLVQDLGFLGGLGTDPNSMIPLILLFSAGYLALYPAPQEATAPQEAAAPQGTAAVEVAGVAAVAGMEGQPETDGGPETVGDTGTAGDSGDSGTGGRRQRVRTRLRPGVLGGAVAGARARSVAAVGALAVIVLGAAPMASAAANRTADPILALAIEGSSASLDLPAPAFSLTDQNGRTVSLASLHGKTVLMTFLDPVCTSDCPIIAQEFKQTGQMLGAQDKNVELVAVVANPTYLSTTFTRAFTRQEGLTTTPNWLYLTGSLGQLSTVWRAYGVTVENLPAGAMAAHNDVAVVIDASGHIREELAADPGPGTSSTQSSFSGLLSQYARQALGRS